VKREMAGERGETLQGLQFKKNGKNVNRMAPLSGSQIYKQDEVHLPPIRFATIFLSYDNRKGWRPVHNLQTG